MDSCFKQAIVTFRMPNDRTLEKRTDRTAKWVDQKLDPQLAQRLKKECKVDKTPAVERIELSP